MTELDDRQSALDRQAVERDRALLGAVVASTKLAVVSTDVDGVVTSWNRGAEHTYGHAESEAVGRRLDFLLPTNDAARARALQRALQGEASPPIESERRRKDGGFIVIEESLSPIRDGRGIVGVASVAQDVTARRRAEDALAATRRELERNYEHLERSNAELEQFAYVASHDLSEPLRAGSGMVQLLARRYRGKLDQDADEFIDFAVDGCTRMKAMIDDVLAYSRAGRIEDAPTPVDLGAVVRDVIDALATPIAEAGAVVEVGELPTVVGVPHALHLLLQNLVSNAVKFRRPDIAPEVRISARRDGDEWVVSVDDNGIGIDPQYETRVFRMFQRLHARDVYEGTGIGLAIAERLAHGWGGRLWLEARRDGGSRFSFTIPDRGDEPR